MGSDDFESIYFEYSDKIYRYIFYFVRDKELAEDLTQETFYKAYKKLNSFRKEASIYTWLIRIARNLVYDFIRRKKFTSFFSKNNDIIFDLTTPPEILIKGEEVKYLYEAIKKLKFEYQEVLILRKIKEFSIKEVSEILGWNEGKVKTTTSRAIVALKKELVRGAEAYGEFFEIG